MFCRFFKGYGRIREILLKNGCGFGEFKWLPWHCVWIKWLSWLQVRRVKMAVIVFCRFFKGYGRIREILLKNGYGFVEFDDYRDADDAVYELNGKVQVLVIWRRYAKRSLMAWVGVIPKKKDRRAWPRPPALLVCQLTFFFVKSQCNTKRH